MSWLYPKNSELCPKPLGFWLMWTCSSSANQPRVTWVPYTWRSKNDILIREFDSFKSHRLNVKVSINTKLGALVKFHVFKLNIRMWRYLWISPFILMIEKELLTWGLKPISNVYSLLVQRFITFIRSLRGLWPPKGLRTSVLGEK